jgi:uncharacterized repeat protein (TIGR03943 family)
MHKHTGEHVDEPGPAGPAVRRGVSPARLAVGLGLAAWAGLFWYLLISGKWSLYLAARVDWLVPVAAVAFSVGAVGRLATARVDVPRELSVREGRSLALMLAPVLLILIVPPGTLTSFAAERRTTFSLEQFSASNPIQEGEPLTFQQLVGAQAGAQASPELVAREGEMIDLVGLAMSPGADGFVLTRFVVSCCVVDATVAEMPVRGVQAPVEEGDWVEVKGPLAIDEAGQAVIDSPQVSPSEQPDPPYLYP